MLWLVSTLLVGILAYGLFMVMDHKNVFERAGKYGKENYCDSLLKLYWPSVIFVHTSQGSAPTVMTSGQLITQCNIHIGW